MSSPPQRILVIGGSQGIGAAVTKSIFALSESAAVFVIDKDIDRNIALPPRPYERLFQVAGNITQASDRENVMAMCVHYLGGIDTIVYAADVVAPIERIEKMDLERVRSTFDGNVFGVMAMAQMFLPQLRAARIANPLNAAYGKLIILTSPCDTAIIYHGWSSHCTSNAALARFISCLAHEEPLISVQGVYPRLTRTKLIEEVVAGRFKGVMAEHEIEQFRVWNEAGDAVIEPPERCGVAVAKMALGLFEGGKSGLSMFYDEHVSMGSERT